MTRLLRIGAIASVFVVGLAGCSGEAPTETEPGPIDPALLDAMTIQALRGLPVDAGPVIEGFEGGTTGFGAGAATSSEFGGTEQTSDPFDTGANTGAAFDSDAGTTEIVGGGLPFTLNFTNHLMLYDYGALTTNPFARGLAVFAPGSSNEISWIANSSSGSYSLAYLTIEFDRSGYVGEPDFGEMVVSGTSYSYEAPNTSHLAIVVFVVLPTEGLNEFDLQWGVALIGTSSAFR